MASESGARQRNNARTGVITIAAISGLAVATISAPKLVKPRPIDYALRVPGSVDVTGVEPESEVLVGGLVRGHVLATDSVQAPDGSVEVVVRFEIEPDPPLYPEARARIVRNLISQQAQVFFTSTGMPGRNREPLPAGTMIRLDSGDAMPPSILTSSMSRAIDNVWGDVLRAQIQWPPLIDDARYRFDNVKRNAFALRDTVSETWPSIQERATALLRRFLAMQSEFECLADQAKSVSSEIAAIQAMSEDDGDWGRLKRSFGGVKESWTALRESAAPIGEALDRIVEQRRRVETAWGKFSTTAREIAGEFRFDRVLANLTLAATEFGKLYDEVTTNPLSALIPNESARDRRRAALDDLSRSMLQSAEEARLAAESLRAILDAGEFAGETGAAAIERLGQTMDQLGALEQALWKFRTSDSSQR